MIKVTLVGFGKVGRQLARAIQRSENAVLHQVYSRSEVVDDVVPKESITHDIRDLSEADVYIIAVSDRAVEEVSALIPAKGKLVVHTAGSLAKEALDEGNRRGVFYPLQTFSKTKEVDFQGLPVFVEAEETSDLNLLEELAKALKSRVFRIDREQRKALHVAAVFACNFSNHLYDIADRICKENNLEFNVLHPLIYETAQKVMLMDPAQAQTGPAIRHDEPTLRAHLEFLGEGDRKEIYELLTRSIQHGR